MYCSILHDRCSLGLAEVVYFRDQLSAQTTHLFGWALSTLWMSQTLSYIPDKFWALHLQRLSQATARLLGFDPAMAEGDWRGAPLEATKVPQVARMVGGANLQVTGTHTPWCGVGKENRTVGHDCRGAINPKNTSLLTVSRLDKPQRQIALLGHRDEPFDRMLKEKDRESCSGGCASSVTD